MYSLCPSTPPPPPLTVACWWEWKDSLQRHVSGRNFQALPHRQWTCLLLNFDLVSLFCLTPPPHTTTMLLPVDMLHRWGTESLNELIMLLLKFRGVRCLQLRCSDVHCVGCDSHLRCVSLLLPSSPPSLVAAALCSTSPHPPPPPPRSPTHPTFAVATAPLSAGAADLQPGQLRGRGSTSNLSLLLLLLLCCRLLVLCCCGLLLLLRCCLGLLLLPLDTCKGQLKGNCKSTCT